MLQEDDAYELYFLFGMVFLVYVYSPHEQHGWAACLYVIGHLDCRENIILASYNFNVS